MRSFCGKLGLFLALVLVCGLPMTSTILVVALFVTTVFLVTGESRSLRTQILTVLGLCFIALVNFSAPKLLIDEGHNYFVTEGKPDEPQSKLLPPEVFAFLQDAFLKLHPPSGWCSPDDGACWRFHGRFHRGQKDELYVPGFQMGPSPALFATSGDALLHSPKYSRQTQFISFRNLSELRAGFTNQLAVSYWDATSDLTRSELPFYVFYEWPKTIAGSQLCWTGTSFWEQRGGHYRQLGSTDHQMCRDLTDADAGLKVFGVSVGTPLRMILKPALKWRAWNSLRWLFQFLGFLGVLAFGVRLRWKTALVPLSLVFIFFLSLSPQLRNDFGHYPLFSGRSDSIVYHGYAIKIARNLIARNWTEFFRGEEDVYEWIPGMRYFVAYGKILFGDTLLYHLLEVSLLPVLFYFLLKGFLPASLAYGLSAIFILNRSEFFLNFGWNHRYYVDLVRISLAEPYGNAIFLLGVLVLFHELGKRSPSRLMCIVFGFLMALTAVVRPFLSIGVGFFMLGVAVHFMSQKQYKLIPAMALGFLPYFGIPIHNWYFGHPEVFFTISSRSPNVYLAPPEFYVRVIRNVLSGTPANPAEWAAITQLYRQWSPSWYCVSLWVSSMMFVTFLALRAHDLKLRLLGLTAIGFHIPLFIYGGEYFRFRLMPWGLSFVLFVTGFYRLAIYKIGKNGERAIGPLASLSRRTQNSAEVKADGLTQIEI